MSWRLLGISEACRYGMGSVMAAWNHWAAAMPGTRFAAGALSNHHDSRQKDFATVRQGACASYKERALLNRLDRFERAVRRELDEAAVNLGPHKEDIRRMLERAKWTH
jgi:hypothetical protein